MLTKAKENHTNIKFISIVLLTIGIGSLWSCNKKQGDGNSLGIAHVIVIGFDGLSPDGLKQANTPTFDRLIQEGASTMHARAVMPTSSSSNWASMIMGAGPDQHGITSNAWERDNFTLPAVTQSEEFLFPTIFDLLNTQRDSVEIGAIYHWAGFGRLFEKDAVDYDQNPISEDETVVVASAYLIEKHPDFTFIHFDHVDHAGHEFGHGTMEYYAAVEKTDTLLAELLRTVEQSAMAENTVLIISSDHGGVGKGHGGESLAEMEIPLIIWGKGVKKNYIIDYPVYQYDNAATVAYLMGLKAPHAWIGKPVKEAFEGTTIEDAYPTWVQLKGPQIGSNTQGYATAGGLFDTRANVSITNPNTQGQIRYTVNGSMPTQDAQSFTEPFEVRGNTIVKSAIFKDNKIASSVTEAFFRIKPKGLEQPVKFDMFYMDNLSFIPSIANRRADGSGTVFEITSEEVKDLIKSNTLFRFQSELELEQTANYQFTTRSDDGSKLYLDGALVVDNDGDHGVREKSGSVALKAGIHTIEVLWFNGGGAGWLDVYIQSDQMPKQILSTNLLRKK